MRWLLIVAFVPVLALASGGRLNSSGCHNSKAEGYHCHNSGAVAPSPSVPLGAASSAPAPGIPVVDVRSLTFTSLSGATDREYLKRSGFYATVVDGNVPAVDKQGNRVTLPAREAWFAPQRGLRILPNAEALPQEAAPAVAPPPPVAKASPAPAKPAPKVAAKAPPVTAAKPTPPVAAPRPTSATQPSPALPSPASRRASDSGSGGLLCVFLCLAGIVATLVWAVRRSGRAPASSAPARIAKRKRWGEREIYARRADTCADCQRRVRENTKVFWSKGLREVRHVDCEAAQRTDEADAFVKLVSRLSSAKGPAARRAVIEAAEGVELSPERRLQLVLEASRIDTDAALEKVAGLKSKEVKRRRLQEALASVKGDAVPDEMQADQIALLEDALRTLEAEPD